MIEFIIQYDNLLFSVKLEKMIAAIMKNRNETYRIKYYKKSDIVSKGTCIKRIYLMEQTSSIIHMVKIVKKINEKNSLILIFSHEYLNTTILKANRFIEKQENCEIVYSLEHAKECILYFLNHEKGKPYLHFEENHIPYTLHIEDILHLDYYKKRKTILYTKRYSYLISKSLNQLKEMLPSYFSWETSTRIVNTKKQIIRKEKKKGEMYTIQDRKRAIYMYYDCYTKAEIVKEFGMSISTLNRWIHEDQNDKLQKTNTIIAKLKQENMGLHFENQKLKRNQKNIFNQYQLIKHSKWEHVSVVIRVGEIEWL